MGQDRGADQAVPTVVAFWLSTEGVEVGKDLDLLALQGTASTYVKVQDARIPAQQVLSTDFYDFLGRCLPTFGILQSAFCMGLATASFRMARANLPGLNEVFFDEFSGLQDQLEEARSTLRDYARCVGTPEAPERRDVLRLRLRVSQLAVALAALEGKTSGGKGYVVTSDANRRLRESLFLPVQSPQRRSSNGRSPREAELIPGPRLSDAQRRVLSGSRRAPGPAGSAQR
ncbi:hypothetical protein [Nesterenkonia pannonica]|uniref:hypothetical protein n=1 Tax=Nesterenkonia pannonica TaxID=1548602 RepID=UPI0021641432|nr:hypothetical protein [Nesterenkonia pannonica]